MNLFLKSICLLLFIVVLVNGYEQETFVTGNRVNRFRLRRNTPCSSPEMCRSKWGYCGVGPSYCGEGCQSGPCSTTTVKPVTQNFITATVFRCVFNTIDNRTRSMRFNGLTKSQWKPQNKEEAAVFLAHVYHETDGLKTLTEYCAPGK